MLGAARSTHMLSTPRCNSLIFLVGFKCGESADAACVTLSHPPSICRRNEKRQMVKIAVASMWHRLPVNETELVCEADRDVVPVLVTVEEPVFVTVKEPEVVALDDTLVDTVMVCEVVPVLVRELVFELVAVVDRVVVTAHI